MSNEDFQKKLSEAYDLIQNDTELSLKIFNELLEIDGNNIEVLNGKGSALMKSYRNDEAEKYFNKSIEISENSSAWINKGLIAKSKKDYYKALLYFERAIHLNPSLNSIISILKKEIFDVLDDDMLNLSDFTSQSREYIKKGIDFKSQNKLWDALEYFNKAIQEDSSCKNSVSILIEDIKSILYNEFVFEAPDFKNTQIDELKVQSLRALLIEENPQKSLDLMDEILKIDERELDALNYKGCILFLFEKYSQSIDCFNKCWEYNGRYYCALFNKALVLMTMNELENALKSFDILLNENMYVDKVKLYKLEILEKLKVN